MTTLTEWEQLTSNSGLLLSCKLTETFETETLKKELATLIEKAIFIRQHGDFHDGSWKSIALISSDGDPSIDEPLGNYKETAYLSSAPYMRQIINSFQARVMRVRLFFFASKTDVYWHFDASESLDYGAVRLHIPILTNPDLDLQICHEKCKWKPGELWYGDFSFPHRLYNGNENPCIHLAMDLGLNQHIKDKFPAEIFKQSKSRELYRKKTQALLEKKQQRKHPKISYQDKLIRIPLRKFIHSLY